MTSVDYIKNLRFTQSETRMNEFFFFLFKRCENEIFCDTFKMVVLSVFQSL